MNTDKIIPRIIGGMGNQLFCYAVARRMAVTNNAELVIDDVSGFEYDHAYKRCYQLDHFSIPCRKATYFERLNPLSRVRRYIMRAINLRRPFHERNYIQQENMDFDLRILELKPHGNLYLDGCWQSEDYFNDVESVIRTELQIKAPTDIPNNKMKVLINDSVAVAVHVRFFDIPGENSINNTPTCYYARAVEKMENEVTNAHYFVFSDEPNAARNLIPWPDERVTCVSHNRGDINAYADLWLMKQCKHFIIPRSTFSWWGAWLCQNTDKIVIIPSHTPVGAHEWGSMGMIFKGCVQIN
ncbi:MAG: alpha-1,2-fucosyltransferase [Bacteroidetes bacterium]|nr:alpha-1,2-fucosyltransferase [Bacteroidota bacterium]